MREKSVETYLREEVEKLGGKAFKFTSPGNAGVPDRVVIIKGLIKFVELKRPGAELRKIQKFRKKQFEQLGVDVRVLDSKEKVDEFIEGVKTCLGK